MTREPLRGIVFEWDPAKAESNHIKHGVGFEEARQVFFDPFFRVENATPGVGEERQAVIGMTESWRCLYVVFVERDEVLRIVSARSATTRERRFYEDP